MPATPTNADTRPKMKLRIVHDERGIALVLALMLMLVLSILTAALVIVVAVNHRESLNSANARRAFGIAEVGLAYAEGNVYGAASAHGTPTAKDTPISFSADGGTGRYWSSVAGDGKTWTMFGEGTYGGVKRSVTAQANVPGPVTVQDTGVWNYLYADKVNADGSCTTTVSGSTSVSVPMYVRGSLCLADPFTGSQLGVLGNLVMQSKGSIGTSTSPITTLAVAGTCSGVTAGTGACNGTTSPIYASHVSSSLGITPGLPTLDLPGKYSGTNPGPASGHGCPVGSGAPSNFFDNDTTLNHSDGTINLFPGSAYDCINGSNELKWQPSVATGCPTGSCLTVNGTFFFDGNLSFSGNTHVVYNGLGSIYVSGSINTAGNFSLCGISGCSASWDTASNELILIAACWNNSTGSTLVSLATTGTYCVDYGGGNTMQVGTYCATDYHINGTATNWGPVLASTLSLSGNLSELVPFKVMPPGTPTNTSTSYLPASAPTYWSG